MHRTVSKPSRFQLAARAPVRARAARALTVRATAEFTMSTEEIKGALIDSFYGTERGLAARSEVRADISELITQLEARNPTSATAEDLNRLSGKWKLAYTSNSELLAILALSRLPGLEVGDITQAIDATTMTVENKVELSVPFSRTALATSASYEVRSPKRLQVKFNRGAVFTPQLLDDVDFPSSLPLPTGQTVDLTPLQPVLAPLQGVIRGGLAAAKGLLGNLPSKTEVPIQADAAQTWLITTYLDEDLRISRGDGGSVFILTKEIIPPVLGETAYANALIEESAAPAPSTVAGFDN